MDRGSGPAPFRPTGGYCEEHGLMKPEQTGKYKELTRRGNPPLYLKKHKGPGDCHGRCRPLAMSTTKRFARNGDLGLWTLGFVPGDFVGGAGDGAQTNRDVIGDRAYRTSSGISISPFAKAARKPLTTFGSNSAPDPFAMIALASKGSKAFR